MVEQRGLRTLRKKGWGSRQLNQNICMCTHAHTYTHCFKFYSVLLGLREAFLALGGKKSRCPGLHVSWTLPNKWPDPWHPFCWKDQKFCSSIKRNLDMVCLDSMFRAVFLVRTALSTHLALPCWPLWQVDSVCILDPFQLSPDPSWS